MADEIAIEPDQGQIVAEALVHRAVVAIPMRPPVQQTFVVHGLKLKKGLEITFSGPTPPYHPNYWLFLVLFCA